MGILICYIAAAAIEMDKWSSNNDGTKYRVWPSWGWICAIVAGALWFFVGTFAACEYARSFRHVLSAVRCNWDSWDDVMCPSRLRLCVSTSNAC